MTRHSWMGLVSTAVALTIGLGAVVPAGAGGVPPGRPGSPPGLPDGEVARIETIVSRLTAERGLVGVTVAVAEPGRRRFERSWGLADVTTGEALTPAHHVRIASITKTLTAVAVLRLVERHRLSLDDPLSRFVDGVPNGDRITIRDLLAMRSGVFEITDDPAFLARYRADPRLPGWQPRDLLDILGRNPPAAEPDTATVYNNANFQLAGLVIEKVTGRPAEQVIGDLVTRPARLRSTTFPSGTELPTPFSHAYVREGPAGEPEDTTPFINARYPFTAGAAVSTVGDLTGWSRQLADGTLLGRRVGQEQRRFTPMGEGVDYGLGLLRIGGWVGHNGRIAGDTSFMATLPATGTTVVVYANTVDSTAADSPADGLFVLIADALHPGSLGPPAPPGEPGHPGPPR